ncbi:M56 family metallopeptidase [Spirillospora sp. CA-142024]|uniref:M56 family metallopeptidase n=1 Tax=Spirillospora sp. CA-142024 TaxID=3240036 RepID=UPI003D8B4B3A
MIGRSVDTGSRSFWALVGISLVLRAVVAYGVCCLAMVVWTVIRDDGPTALWTSRSDLIPGVLILVLTVAGLLAGTWSLGRSLWHTCLFGRDLSRHRTVVPAELQSLAGRLGIGAQIRVVAASRPFAFTYGIAQPRVLVSTGLLKALTERELAAVLTHERAHVRGRDPLKTLFAGAIPARHFYVPGLVRLRHRFTAGRELAADRAAIAAHGTAALASSLLKVSEGPAWARSVPAAAMASDALLAMRITQLETAAEPQQPRAGTLARIGTATSVLAFVAACAWSAVVVAQAMPGCMP